MHDFSIEQSCQLQLAVSRCQSWLGRAATSSTSYRFRCSEHFASVFGITQGNWFQMVSLMLQLYAVVTFAFLICSTCSDICSIFSETWIWFLSWTGVSLPVPWQKCHWKESNVFSRSAQLWFHIQCASISSAPLWFRISSSHSTRQLKKQID